MEELYDPKRRWKARGLCLGEDPDLFFAETGLPGRVPSPTAQKHYGKARLICQRCPVLEQCRRDTVGEEYGVWGGLDEHERWLIRRKLPRAAAKWPREKRLAWGQTLRDLREDGGMTLREIGLATGFSAPLTEALLKELEEHGKSGASLVELPALTPKQHKPDFPQARGERDAWVRHDTIVADGWYLAQTADGKWFRFNCFSGRGNVRKWFAAEDVLIYRPQAVVIEEYVGRPDKPGKPRPIAPAGGRAYVSTHCPARHAYTEANTHRNKHGWRECRTCRRVRTQRRREEKRAAAQPLVSLVA